MFTVEDDGWRNVHMSVCPGHHLLQLEVFNLEPKGIYSKHGNSAALEELNHNRGR